MSGQRWAEKAKEQRLKFPGPCEFFPVEQRAAWDHEVHAEAEVIVGANGQWRLCKACAALPFFNRFRNRREIK